jgi:deoxyribodipyrimidine photo-lyase
VPGLAALPDRYLRAPWQAPADVLAAAGVRLGANYPRPVVDHGVARRRFLDLAKQHLEPAKREILSRRLA